MKIKNLALPIMTGLFFTSPTWASPIARHCKSIHNLSDFQKANIDNSFSSFAKALPASQAAASLPGNGESEFASLVQTLNSPPFKIFYSTSGTHAVDADYPQKVADALQNVWKEFSGIAVLNMIDDTYPVYLENMDQSYYGYVQPVSPIGDNPNTSVKETRSSYSYMALRNSYPSSVYGDPTKALEVTIAHEFFHSVQTSRNAFEKPWLFEAQATAMETVIYPKYDDNHQYLGFWTQFPYVTLTYESDFSGKDSWEGHEYGVWPIFYRGQDLYGWEFQKNVLEASVAAGTDSTKYGTTALNNALKENNTDLSSLIASSISAQILWDENLSTSNSYETQSQLQTLGTGFKTETDLNYNGFKKTWSTSNAIEEYGSAVIKLQASKEFSVVASSFTDIEFYLFTLIAGENTSSFSKITPTNGNILNRNSEAIDSDTQYYIIAINPSNNSEDFSITLNSFDSTSPIFQTSSNNSWAINSNILELNGNFAEGKMKILNSSGQLVWSGNNNNKIHLQSLKSGAYYWANSLGHKISFKIF